MSESSKAFLEGFFADIGMTMFLSLLSFVIGFLLGAHVMYDDKAPTREELQEQVDTQQMRLDILIDELKRIDVGGQVNWDRL